MTRFHHLTDTHYPSGEAALVDYVRNLKCGRLGPAPDYIIHTGDIVDGASNPEELSLQHQSARALLESTGIPYFALAHNHDRLGETSSSWGRTFQQVHQQPLMQAVVFGRLEFFLLSGTVTDAPGFLPEGGGEPPLWGYDLFDPHVLQSLQELVHSNSQGGYRVLCTHLPLLLQDELSPEILHRHKKRPIGDDGLNRILPVLRDLNIRAVWSGHLHAPCRHRHGDIEFIVGAPFVGEYVGFGEAVWDDNNESLRYHFRSWDVIHVD